MEEDRIGFVLAEAGNGAPLWAKARDERQVGQGELPKKRKCTII